MPSRLSCPIIAVNMNRVAGVDPSNVDNLFSMWTIFSKCGESLENGRRLENLSWRLWNRETFCCNEPAKQKSLRKPLTPPPSPPESATTSTAVRAPRKKTHLSPFSDMPALSSSVESASSEDEWSKKRYAATDATRPCCNPRPGSLDRRGKEKHLTPVNLAKIMEDIDRNKSATDEWMLQRIARYPSRKAASMSDPPDRVPPNHLPPSSKSLSRSVDAGMEHRSTHSVVRGFSPGRISVSTPSLDVPSTAATTPSKSPNKATSPVFASKKSKPVFYIGSSSSSDDNLEDSYDSYKAASINEKRTSFSETVDSLTVYDDEITSEDDAVSESALEDDDMAEWESSSESGRSTGDEQSLFKRVESRPELTSRRSLLSTMLHEPQRAAEIAAVARRSPPASSTTRRTGSTKDSFHNGVLAIHEENEFPGSKPIKRIDSRIPPAALHSPRTTRRNMLANELTESLRKNLLWERQQKNTTASAHLKRRHTAADVTKLAEFPQTCARGGASKNNSWNNAFFDQGQYEYHAAGW